MDVRPIQDFIEANTDLQSSIDLFATFFPDGVAHGVLVIPEEEFADVDHEVPGVYTNAFQVIIRDSNVERGLERANEIFELLNSEKRRDLGAIRTAYVRANGRPYPFPRSDGDQVEWATTYIVRYEFL